MNFKKHWEIVNACKDHPHPEDELANQLRKLSPKEIFSFETHFHTLANWIDHPTLDAAAILLNGWYSDDGIEYFRYGLIALGQEAFKAIAKSPDVLAAYWNRGYLDNEAFSYTIYEVYKEVTGQDFFDDESKYRDVTVEDLPRHPKWNEQWDFNDKAECRKRLPKLSALRFGNATA